MTTRTNGAVDVDDEHSVSYAVRRLRTIAAKLGAVNAERDSLYAERVWIVYQLRGVVPQQQLAEACACGVDMVKNIAARGQRVYGNGDATL